MVGVPVRKWRNWQTRRPQEPVGETPWEFKSPLPHHALYLLAETHD